MKNRLIVSLDLKGLDSILSLVNNLGDEVLWYKIGAINFTAYSTILIKDLKNRGKRVFLDLKYHDIPNTVKEAVFTASTVGADILTIHSMGGIDMMRAASDGLKEYQDKFSAQGPLIAAVTVLTSANKDTLKRDMFIDTEVEDLVLKLSENAQKSGIRGIVASPRETKAIKERFGNYFSIITPGIRPKGSAKDDQSRVTTPYDAIKMGSSYIVVGRPIYKSNNPVKAVKDIIKDMEGVC